MTSKVVARPPAVATRRAGRWLTCGICAGAIYVSLGVLQFLFRDGLDIRRHQLSVATNGSLGWVQVTNFVVTGVLTFAAAVGMRAALTPGRGSRWVPRLVAAYGAGLIGAGVFRADPFNGFPPGTPDGLPASPSWHAGVHLLVASLGFVALTAGCFVLARRVWRAYSLATGSVLLITWLAIGVAPDQAVVSVVFVISALHASVWVAAVCARLLAGRV